MLVKLHLQPAIHITCHIYETRILFFSRLFVARKSHLPCSLGQLITTGNTHMSLENRLVVIDQKTPYAAVTSILEFELYALNLR